MWTPDYEDHLFKQCVWVCGGECGSVCGVPGEAIQQRLMPSAGTIYSVSFTFWERQQWKDHFEFKDFCRSIGSELFSFHNWLCIQTLKDNS